MERYFAKIILVFAALFILSACMPQVKIPVETRLFDMDENNHASCLVVLLPGRGDRVYDFERSGFIRAAQRKGFKGDLLATDLHIGYYYDRVVMQRLEEDVIEPARKNGYSEIWIVGISMGGMGSIMHQREYPQSVEGLVFIAPYLGEDEILDEVEKAGGVLAWEPGDIRERDFQRKIWVWIQDYANNGASTPPLWLAYGEGDRFARSSLLLSAVLPRERIMTTSGGHYWRAWRRLWNQLLDKGVLCGE